MRELISNASDALDKIRFLSLTDSNALAATDELSIKVKADKDNNVLHITDTGIGMTKDDLIKQLGTIAKSGTSEFFSKLQDAGKKNKFQKLFAYLYFHKLAFYFSDAKIKVKQFNHCKNIQ